MTQGGIGMRTTTEATAWAPDDSAAGVSPGSRTLASPAPAAPVDLALVLDERGLILWVSESAGRHLGVAAEDRWDMMSPRAEPGIRGALQPWRTDQIWVMPGRSYVELLCADGMRRGFIVEAEDISQSPRRVKVALTPEGSQTAGEVLPAGRVGTWLPPMISSTEVLANAPMPFAITDACGTIFGANAAMRELVGASRLARSLGTYFSNDDWTRILAAALSPAPGHSNPSEVRLIPSRGTLVWVRVAGAPVRGGSQIVWQLVDMSEDHDARERTEQRLRKATEIAHALQRAILPPIPDQMGSLRVASRYQSSSADVEVGGDLYGAGETKWGTRFIVGDVRGKGMDAVGIASHVLERFGVHSLTTKTLHRVAEKIDEDLRRLDLASDGAFVTAVLAEVSPSGRILLSGSGHPDPWLVRGGVIHEIPLVRTLPLGMGSRPRAVTFELQPGDRVVLFTDGLLECRSEAGRFIDPRLNATGWVVEPDLGAAADALMETVTGCSKDDDVACLILEYQPATGRPAR